METEAGQAIHRALERARSGDIGRVAMPTGVDADRLAYDFADTMAGRPAGDALVLALCVGFDAGRDAGLLPFDFVGVAKYRTPETG